MRRLFVTSEAKARKKSWPQPSAVMVEAKRWMERGRIALHSLKGRGTNSLQVASPSQPSSPEIRQDGECGDRGGNVTMNSLVNGANLF